MWTVEETHRSELSLLIKAHWNLKQTGSVGGLGAKRGLREALVLCTLRNWRTPQEELCLYSKALWLSLPFPSMNTLSPSWHTGPVCMCLALSAGTWLQHFLHTPHPLNRFLVTKHLVNVIFQSTLKTLQRSIRKCEFLCQWCSLDMVCPKSW